MDIESNDDKVSSIRKNSGMDEQSPIDQRDIFEHMLQLNMSDKEERAGSDHQAKTERRHYKRIDFRKILNSSSSNDRLIPHQPNPDHSRGNSERARNMFETQNSMDQESFRKSFKKKIQQSFSVENTIRDSSSEVSNHSESRSFNQILPKQYREEQLMDIQEKRGGCNCKRSKCLKLYCECFQNKLFCNPNCKCYDCGNKVENAEQHKKAVIQALARNAHGFEDQKRIAMEEQHIKEVKTFSLGVELQEVKKGCKCKKTHCLKKYCECYYNGKICGIFCRCEDCHNTAFHQGRKQQN